MDTEKLSSLFNEPSKINGKIATVQYIKMLGFKKEHVHLNGDLLKYTTAKNVKIGVNHDHATNNQQVREHDDPDYKANEPPKGKTWEYYPILLKDVKTGKKRYIKFEQWNDLIIYDRTWEFEGKILESIEEYKPILLAASWKHYPVKQVTERINTYLTIDLDNIIYIDVNGVRYIKE